MTCCVCTSIMIGAYSADRIVSTTAPSAEREDAAAASASARRKDRAHEAQDLRREQHDHREDEQRRHARRVELRPVRKQLEAAAEILGADQRRLQGQREADDQQHQPQRRGQVAHDADGEVRAVRQRQALAYR